MGAGRHRGRQAGGDELVTDRRLSRRTRVPVGVAGVAVRLLVAGALPDLAGPGVLLASVAGLFVEMTSPMLGVVMLLALLPAKLLPLGTAGAAGAIAGRLAVTRLQPADDSAA